MQDQLITFETARLAARKQFEWRTGLNKAFNRGSTICTQALLQKWLREEKKISVEPYFNASGACWSICKTDGTHIIDYDYSGPNDSGCWDTYEEALENALQVALNLIK